MSRPIIEVENLSKCYRLGAIGATSLREEFERRWERLRNRVRRSPGPSRPGADQRFWALKDVSFSVEPGEVLGIVGRNGAGKSSLLKILSRITEPTTGWARLRGRVASLLEVGTGFHPELTGRENVFLNGAILGMTRAEVRSKFDEIVAFAEVEQFIDTPVKRYSSGMYVRLAFAVAAHLEPEILIVDEVLAVGDAEFQQKCLGKMQDVSARGGRTVLFVSHNLPAMRHLCKTGLLLRQGAVVAQGPMGSVIEKYNKSDASNRPEGKKVFPAVDSRKGVREAGIRSIATLDREGRCRSEFDYGEPFAVAIEFETEAGLSRGFLGCQIRTPQGVPLFTSHSNDACPQQPIAAGRHTWICRFDENSLTPGIYYLEAGIANRSHVIDLKTDELSFQVVNGTKYRPVPSDGRPGHLFFNLHWERGPKAAVSP